MRQRLRYIVVMVRRDVLRRHHTDVGGRIHKFRWHTLRRHHDFIDGELFYCGVLRRRCDPHCAKADSA